MQIKNQLKAANYIKVLIHLTIWVCLVAILNSHALDLEWGAFSRENNTLLVPLIYGMAFNAALFYWNAYWMVPKALHKKKYRKYYVTSILVLFFTTIIELICDITYFFSLSEIENELVKEYHLAPGSEILNFFLVWVSAVFIINLFYFIIAFLYRFPKDWKRNERAKQQLIQDKLTAELSFLRAQINPHFLFNGINSIYHLIGKDDEKAKHVLLNFSELLRYQLYECDEESIPLKKELSYIKNYILLEEIRKGQDAKIKVKLPSDNEIGSLNTLRIAPLLLTPFLENAFKYLSNFSEDEKNLLNIQISIVNNELIFYVENTIDLDIKVHSNGLKAGGIGLENVKRRLNMLYPKKHQLEILNTKEIFSVSLKIKLL